MSAGSAAVLSGAAAEPSPVSTVYIVDDEPNVLASLRRLLRRQGFDVHVDTDAEQAVRRVAELQPDVVMSDYRMPGMNGTALLSKVRDVAPECGRVLMSGEADRDVVIGAINDGAVHRYVDKPWKDAAMVDMLRECAAAARGRREENRRQESLAVSHEALQRAVYRDPATNLPNRTLLLERFERQVRGHRRDGARIALFAVGLHGTDAVRESYGPAAADAFVVAAAERLGRHLRQADMIARHGDDGLLVMLDDVQDLAQVEQIAERMLADLQAPFEVEAARSFVDACIGASLFPIDGDDGAALITHAESALRRARRDGLRMRFFSTTFQVESRERLALEAALREAVAERTFRLHFQPRVNAATGVIEGAEALLRWSHPEFGAVPPGRFVPVLESTGLIVELGSWVIEEAALALARWRACGRADLTLSVNVSALQFRRSDVDAIVRAAMNRAGEDPSAGRLEIEVTESLLIDTAEGEVDSLLVLSGSGVPLVIDDFGTGYSSFGYLINQPLDVLKIDRSFIARLGDDRHVEKVVQAIIAMSHALDMKVVAEGVETVQQRDLLRTLGCDQLQGYLLGRPMPEEDFLAVGR